MRRRREADRNMGREEAAAAIYDGWREERPQRPFIVFITLQFRPLYCYY
jgi:hypothetical protein